MDIVFNGKFLTSAPTGVHRVAGEIILALDEILAKDKDVASRVSAELLMPEAETHDLSLSRIASTKSGRLSGYLRNILWEQVELPRLARGRTLVSLCNISPLAYSNSVMMMHDAQVYSTPQSYSKGFRLWYKTNFPVAAKRGRLVLTVSEYSKSQLVHYGIAKPEKIVVVPNGCDHILRVVPQAGYPASVGLEGRNFVLALANTQAHKNVRILIEAFSDPALADVELVLFGAAGRADFEKEGVQAGPNVRFLGRISDGELAALFGQAKAFACPSLTEGFGLPPLEAMLLGCPAIIAPCGALPEVCGDAALIADPHRASEWTSAIRRLVDDVPFREEMRRKGLDQARGFTWERAARTMLKAIEASKPARG
ncbi:glycosyltransferase family 4 protein [Aureimonas psammosilenae]|uniref:glycosyltransferase family 4 protein n=1 Tax=Aureimonas psammosilenae TaxID=2495496 RepID=UPI001869DA49|nr:glycosyltransferase family 1 protein [Aureimonas psammosilenae]